MNRNTCLRKKLIMHHDMRQKIEKWCLETKRMEWEGPKIYLIGIPNGNNRETGTMVIFIRDNSC